MKKLFLLVITTISLFAGQNLILDKSTKPYLSKFTPNEINELNNILTKYGCKYLRDGIKEPFKKGTCYIMDARFVKKIQRINRTDYLFKYIVMRGFIPISKHSFVMRKQQIAGKTTTDNIIKLFKSHFNEIDLFLYTGKDFEYTDMGGDYHIAPILLPIYRYYDDE